MTHQDNSPHEPKTIPYPGETGDMAEQPRDEMRDYLGRGLLAGKTALVTGGDSGIGRATAIAFAKEGADVAIAYLSEDEDARRTVDLIEAEGRSARALDILVNNVAYQQVVDDFLEVDPEQWYRTFDVNIHSFFHTTRAAVPHLTGGGAIINTSSINGLRGNDSLIDYSATKGAVLALTYSLAQSLMKRRIRVNCVAPGPVWTPLIPATMPAEAVKDFGTQAPMGRAAQPDEIAPSYVFFAAEQLSSYYTGEVLAPIGGETLPG